MYIFKKFATHPVRRTKDSGSAMIEFSLVAPLFFLVLFGIFEIAAILLVQTSLETALFQITRFGRTGDTVSVGGVPQSQTSTAQSLAATYSFGLIDPTKLSLVITPYTSFCNPPGTSPSCVPDLNSAPTSGINFGTGGQIVLYTLSYQWKMFTPLVSQYFSNTGIITIEASSVVVNEPF